MGLRAGAAKGVAALAGAIPSCGALAAPFEGRRVAVPAARRRLQRGDDLRGRRRVRPLQGTALEDALDRLGHVQPAAAERRVERHDAVGAEPEDEGGRLVADEVVEHQEQAHWREFVREGEGTLEARLPRRPGDPVRLGHESRGARERGKDGGELPLEPRVEHRVGATGHPRDPDRAAGWVEQGQQLGRAVAHVLVRLLRGLPDGLPTAAGIRHGLERPRLILAPHGQPQRLAQPVGLRD